MSEDCYLGVERDAGPVEQLRNAALTSAGRGCGRLLGEEQEEGWEEEFTVTSGVGVGRIGEESWDRGPAGT